MLQPTTVYPAACTVAWIRIQAGAALLVVGCTLAAAGLAYAQLKTDYGVYPEPPLPKAGAIIVDPVFGTRILRVTDAADGNSQGGTAYSYWPVFNKDNRYLVVGETFSKTRAKFFHFNPATLSVSNGFLLSAPPSGLQEYVLAWSGIHPTVTFGVGGHKIWQVDVETQQATLVKDLTTYGVGGLLKQMLKRLDDDVFALSILDGAHQVVGYLVCQRSTDKVLI